MKGHLELLAQPVPTTSQGLDCKSFYMEDDTSQDRMKIVMVMEDNDPSRSFSEDWSQSFPISAGTASGYQLRQIAAAFEIAADSSGKDYDAVHNNCATFILSMLAGVGYRVDTDGMEYAANRLAESDYINVLLESTSLTKLGQAENYASSDPLELMRGLVEQYVANRHCERHGIEYMWYM